MPIAWANNRLSAKLLAALGLALSPLLAGTVSPLAEDRAPPPADTIFARKTLMNSINDSMDEIEAMLAPGAKIDSAEAREHADQISVLLLTFPHLFPPSTNLWKEDADRDPAVDTFALPNLWEHFGEFYSDAQAASKLAQQASRAANRTEFQARIAELRAACNGCHAAFQKTAP